MQKIAERIKYWGQLLLLPLYWFSFLFPRNKKIWLFGSTFGRRFADNPRYFYLYCSQHKDEIGIRPIWISHDKGIVKLLTDNGYEAYYYHSVKGIWYALRGKVYLFDNYSKDINFWQSGGAVKINMWHGVGNKKINYDNEYDKVRHPQNIMEKIKYFPRRLSDEKSNHYVLTTSPMISQIFSNAFRIPIEHMIEIGYPRNDILFSDTTIRNLYQTEEKILINLIEDFRKDGCKILAYIPTFRPSEKKFFEICSLNLLNDFFVSHNIVLICKPHPKSMCKTIFEKCKYSNIYCVSADVDVNSFLREIDLLIVDYSSVYSDYMLLDRPVVAFHYDYDEYIKNTRDSYFDYDEYMFEMKASNMDELESSILIGLTNDNFKEKRKIFRKRLFKWKDSCSSIRLVDQIKKL